MSRSTSLKVHCIPRLRDDGSNWHAYREQFITHIESKKYSRVIEGYPFQKPKDLVPQDGEYYLESDMNVPLSGEQLEEHCGKLDEFKAREAYVRGIIQETVGPLLLEQLQLFEAGNARELWEHMREMFEKRGNMAAVETLRKLQSLRCTDPSKVRAHVTEMWGYTEQLSAMGAPLSDIQFVTHLSASLPPSFQPLLSALDTTHNILNIPLTSTTLINKLFIEADTQTALRNINSRTTTQPAAESSAMAATAGRGRGRGRGRSDRPPCENCKKKGHSKEKCWAKGGGAEGNAPEWWNPRKQPDGKEGASANIADQVGPNYALITTSDNADSTPATVTGTPEDIEDFDHALATSENPKHYGIIIDCGASRHFTPLRSKLLNYVEIEHEPLRTADGRMFKMIGKGNMEFFLPMGPGKPPTQVTLMNVYYSPNMAYTLVSVQTLTKKGFSLLFENDACTIKTPGPDSKTLGRVPLIHGLYRISPAPDTVAVAAAAIAPLETLHEFHRRMGHVNHDDLKKMVRKGTAVGINVDLNSKPEFCEACIRAKAKIIPFPKFSERRGITAYGHKIAADLCGPVKVQSLGGKKYFMLLKDFYSGETVVYFLRTKDEALSYFKKYHKWVLVQRNASIKVFGSDRGGEFTSNEFDDYLEAHGIIRHLTTHDSPQSNGAVERGNQTHNADVRACTIAARLPWYLWAECLAFSVFIRNRTPTSSVPGSKTPHEMATGEVPDLSGIMEWGRRVFVRLTNAGKHEPRAVDARFVGFDRDSKGIRVFWHKKRSVTVERNFYIDKSEAMKPGDDWDEGEINIFEDFEDGIIPPTPEASEPLDRARNVGGTDRIDGAPKTSENEPEIVKNEPVLVEEQPKLRPTPPTPSTNLPEPAQPIPAAQIDAQTDNDDIRSQNDDLEAPEPVQGRNLRARVHGKGFYKEPDLRRALVVEDLVGVVEGLGQLEPGQIEVDLERAEWFCGVREYALLAGGEEPQTLAEALSNPDEAPEWKKGMRTEIDQMEKHETFDLVEAPTDANIIQNKWVFRRKTDSDGNIKENGHRARLVAKGFTQVYGVDYVDKSAPVVRSATLRTLLAIAAQRGYVIHQADAKNAYLNSKPLRVPLYMEIPPGYTLFRQLPDHISRAMKEGRRIVCRLNKPLYGTKQGGNEWYHTLREIFLELGYSISDADQAVFYFITQSIFTIVACATDDFTIIADSVESANKIKSQLGSRFELVDLGEINWLLGIKITRDLNSRVIRLSQEAYAKHVVKVLGLEDANHVLTPLEPGVDYTDDAPGIIISPRITNRHQIYLFRQGLGLLLYLATSTRPDIMYAVCTLARHMANPRQVHLNAMKRVVRYIKGTMDFCLTLGGELLTGFSDADFASDNDRFSISGYAFFIGKGPVSWSSKKQTLVTLSTVESEYIALAHATKELIWLRRIIEEFFHTLDKPTILYCDNQGAISISKDPTKHMSTKHIDTPFHFVRQTVNNHKSQIIYCPTDKMVADIFTKSLARVKFELFRALLEVGPPAST